MKIMDKPAARAFLLALLLAATAAVLAGGFIFLKDYYSLPPFAALAAKSSLAAKALLTAIAIAWGLGATALLFYAMNALAETLPRKARSIAIAAAFAGPAIALLFWFLVLPTLRTLFLSFFDETGRIFVWLDNYRYAFTNATMLESFGNNLLWMVFGTSGTVFLGLVTAVLADRSTWEKAFKAIIFAPMAISFVGSGVIWKFMYAYKGEGTGIAEIGLLNAVVAALGGKPQAWLLMPFWNNFFLIAIMVWLQTGYAMVILSAAIKGIPAELLEAARIDGANEFQVFFRIIIPSISGSIVTVTTTVVIFSLKLFDIVRVMTGGNYGTNVIANQFYIEQFTFGNSGRASAIAIVLLAAVVPVLVYNLRQFAHRKAFK